MALRFETLDIWKLALQYARKLFAITGNLPNNYKFNLGEQLNRAVLSISNNIAEGSGSASTKDFQNFLNIAIRSTFEVISMLHILKAEQLFKDSEFDQLYTDGELLVKKIQAFRNSLLNQNP